MSKEQFGQIVEQVLEELPEPFATYIEEVSVEVRPLPGPKQLERVGSRGEGLLLGLYVGRPRTMRNVEDDSTLPDMIYIFQDNIERICRSEADLRRQVRITVLHEIGHHFGMDEEDLDQLGYG